MPAHPRRGPSSAVAIILRANIVLAFFIVLYFSQGGCIVSMKRNNKPILSLLALCLILVTTAVSVYADTRYVSDELIITMRAGAGVDYRIIRSLKAETPLEVLEETGEYYRVQTKDGKEGWVLKQYITADIPKTIIIAGLRKEIEKLKGDMEKLDREREAIKKDFASEKGLRTSAVKELE